MPAVSRETWPAGVSSACRFGMRVLAVANQKGGVGKTTTTVNLGAALARRGHRTVVVDLDPQGNLTAALGLTLDEELSVYDALVDGEPLAAVIRETQTPDLLVCPSDPSLSGADLELASDETDPQRRASRLRECIAAYAGTEPAVSFVLLDCPPSLGLLTVNALVAADAVLVPMQCEYFSMQGLARLLDTVERVAAAWNPGLDVAGVLFNMVDRRTNLTRQVIEQVRREFGARVFASEIPRSVRLAEAPSYGVPLQSHDPRSPASGIYSELAAEVMAR